jgi:hypothetical protein
VLDREGHVVKQGPPDKITISQEFIHPASTEAQSIDSDEPCGGLSTSKERTAVQEPSSSDGMDQQRQIGDLSVYKFYFSSLGWLSLAIFAGAVIVSSVFATLQCMTSSPSPQAKLVRRDPTDAIRCVDHFVVSTQRNLWQL